MLYRSHLDIPPFSDVPEQKLFLQNLTCRYKMMLVLHAYSVFMIKSWHSIKHKVMKYDIRLTSYSRLAGYVAYLLRVVTGRMIGFGRRIWSLHDSVTRELNGIRPNTWEAPDKIVNFERHGHGGQTISCRGNCGQPESLVHILQSCWITHDARCARHNRVARELAKRLRRLGYTVFEELRAPTSTSFIKPDLIAVRERRATVIDVSIVSDGRGMTVWNEKKQKYGADEFSLAIISALRAIGCDVDFLVHQPMIISYRGICFPQSAKAVIGLGLSKVTVSDLCLLAIVGCGLFGPPTDDHLLSRDLLSSIRQSCYWTGTF
ncbi:retrovirus-related Pol polyprotein from type-1 retrotransposable element R2 [Clonorchis sinensis]|uniref:Retrovirus-related Pol polyprotein from type-1 retrotransposable element R2 n=1 Tax=Clonorchis sinensis TaxID=79923 RepID=G7YN54_CLOSI|nr:retrovirus-related Pol polyprotein from type-1 retrotransposable element R2 [Clonorchis sinensis]